MQLGGMASWKSKKGNYSDSFNSVKCPIPKSFYKFIVLHLLFRLRNVGHNTSLLVKATENMIKYFLCSQRDNEAISDIMSEGLELLEASIKLVCKY
jgi:hypothetical protein